MKNLNAFGKVLCVSSLLALVGIVVYLINSLTGYMAGKCAVNALVVLLPLVCVAGAAALLFVVKDLPSVVTGAATLALAVLLAWATVIFVTQRVDVIGDMLNPVNHPGTQVTAVVWSVVGLVLYLLAFLGTAVSTIGGKLKK